MSTAPEAWQTNAPTPFMAVGEDVSVWTIGADRFQIESPLESRVVRGYKLARVVAHEMAEKGIRSRHAPSEE